jgi:hypothetical protein
MPRKLGAGLSIVIVLTTIGHLLIEQVFVSHIFLQSFLMSDLYPLCILAILVLIATVGKTCRSFLAFGI